MFGLFVCRGFSCFTLFPCPNCKVIEHGNNDQGCSGKMKDEGEYENTYHTINGRNIVIRNCYSNTVELNCDSQERELGVWLVIAG